jgi:hypothetical protein
MAKQRRPIMFIGKVYLPSSLSGKHGLWFSVDCSGSGSVCPSTLLAQVRYLVPDVVRRPCWRKFATSRRMLSVDLAGASSLPRAGCSDATPVASTYEGFLIGEGVRPSTSSCRMCVPPQALYLPNEDWSAWGTRVEGLSWSKPLAFNFIITHYQAL